ncbi:hypothetical protein T02_16309 [Trichinella nativa]|uniref:Uncharacterized protein n=1 Tax=Trichinella nativa TaxID=6335 RepID=A0A0V1KKS8_9BILA|nr:hypothetical protein T02_16309 [Trichinella nativa]
MDDIHKIPGKVTNKDLKEIQSIVFEVFERKCNAHVIGMNIESAVCFKYAPVTSAEMRRSELVRRMWEIIKERNLLENFESMNLQDPTNRAFVICDTQFEDIFTCILCRILEIEMKIWNESTEQSLQNKMSYGFGKNGLMHCDTTVILLPMYSI